METIDNSYPIILTTIRMEEIARLKHVNEELVYRCINQTARKHGITEEMCLKVILNALEPKRKKDGVGHYEYQGERETMEDALVVTKIDDTQLYAIFDGHGGRAVADLLQDEFPSLLSEKLADLSDPTDDAIVDTIKEAFVVFDESLFLRDVEEPIKSGSTAIVVIRRQDTLFIANLGDSRAVIFDDSGKIKYHSKDQKPTDPPELKRIEQVGGKVINGRVGGILATARAFGDFHLGLKLDRKGGYLGDQSPVGIIPTVDILKLTPSPHQRYLVMACDGLWDVRDNQPVADEIVRELPGKTLSVIAKSLAYEAVNTYRSGDNVSVLIVRL